MRQMWLLSRVEVIKRSKVSDIKDNGGKGQKQEWFLISPQKNTR